MSEDTIAKKETVASKVLSALEATMTRAGKLASIVGEKTESVTSPSNQRVEKACEEPKVLETYSPLFNRIREMTENINRSLATIEDIMRRCEL